MLRRIERLRGSIGLRSGPTTSIPHLFTLRRVSRRCRQILPLGVMKRYQCVVIGMTREALTIAIVDEKSASIFDAIEVLTGRHVFPVLVEPARMQLLLRRIERVEQGGHNRQHHLTRFYSVDTFPLNIHTTLLLLTSYKATGPYEKR